MARDEEVSMTAASREGSLKEKGLGLVINAEDKTVYGKVLGQ